MPVEQGHPQLVAPAKPPDGIFSRGALLDKVRARFSSSIILPSDSLYAQRESIGSTIQRIPETMLDRRGFLIGAGVTAAGAAILLEGGVIADHILETVDKKGQELFNLCNVSPQEFFDRYGEKLKRVRLATTFIPEDHDWKDGSRIHHNPEAALKELKIIVGTLGIKNIRIGIRWENAIDKNGKLDFSFYEPLFRYCFDKQVKLCLNIGLKTCGYPEISVQNHLLDKQGNPLDGGVVKLGSPIVPISFDYSHQLLSYLSSNFSEDKLALIETVQPENEPFVSYGNKGWTMDPEYLKEFAKLCSSYLPKAKILVNDNLWNYFNRDKAPNLVAEMTESGDNRWVYGVNYYNAVPQIEEFLRMVPFLSDKAKRMIERFDPLILGMVPPLSYIPMLSFENIKNLAKKTGFPVHVSEAEAEHFGGVRLRDGKEPGDSLAGYQYQLYMASEYIALDSEQTIEVSIWRASQQARKILRGDDLTSDDHGIIYGTQRLVQQAASGKLQ